MWFYLVILITNMFTSEPIPTDHPITIGQDIPKFMQFDTNLIELGEVKKGESKEFSYEFTNTGNEDIEIEFMSSCDCTTLDYPMGTIAPGEKGVINVVFDSSEKTKSETVDIDIDLVNKDPKTGYPIFIRINYSFILIN